MWGEHMPEINIEQKIQEALKRKSFKDNKLEYITLALVFCLILYVTFVVGYLVPFLAILIFLFVDIPLMMGFKHFIWFGPASGESLLDGFKISMICGYLNFISYFKIFVTSNINALIGAFAAFIISEGVGTAYITAIYGDQIYAIYDQVGVSIVEKTNQMMAIEGFVNMVAWIELIALAIAAVSFIAFKLPRAILPYVSFLRLNNLEGKSMDGVIAHTKRVIGVNKVKYYLFLSLFYCLYIIPVGAGILTYYFMSKNPVYSLDTLTLISALSFFVGLCAPFLSIELYCRKYCVDANQAFHKEQNMMLNDALNDLNKNSSNKN